MTSDKQKKRGYAFLLLYLQGLIQGVGFTTIPAAGNFLTSSQGFHLTTAQYGSLFIPMVIGAILSSLLAGGFGRQLGIRAVLLIAAAFNIVGMTLLAFLAIPFAEPYSLLLIIMFLLGTGFGANITALNPFVIYYFPNAKNSAVTALHSCLGIGTALGPLAFTLFFHLNIWWADAAVIAACYFVLLLLSLIALPIRISFVENEGEQQKSPAFSVAALTGFIAIALFYGIVETTYGNWAGIFLHQEKKFSVAASNNALALFWAFVTCGRVVVAIISAKVSVAGVYRCLPVLLLISLAAIAAIHHTAMAYISFAIAGLGCSAFLPLTVSFAEQRLLSQASLVSGLIIANYMIGYAISSWGVGLLHKVWEVSLVDVYIYLSIPIILLAIFCFLMTREKSN